jgi:hypothetical protein
VKTALRLSKRNPICAFVIIAVLAVRTGHAHEEPVHQQITLSAFRSSAGINVFLSDQLGAPPTSFTVGPVLRTRSSDYPQSRSDSPAGWLSWGAYMEDDEDPPVHSVHFLRSSDHFYAVLHTPKWLTDGRETWGKLPDHLTESYTWATSPGMAGPDMDKTFAGPNRHTWQDARDKQFDALTLPAKADRDAALALTLYALGHVLHLNQDLSQPDHVRNDEHVPRSSVLFRDGKHWIEEYGLRYLADSKKAGTLDTTFPLQPRGWAYWRSEGFRTLKSFWDRGKYTGSTAALDADAAQTSGEKLGLAEYSNGNFIGEDAIYAERFPQKDSDRSLHYFPFPTLLGSTTFGGIAANMAPHVRQVVFDDGTTANRLFVDKVANGIHLRNHSAVCYHADKDRSRPPSSTLYVATTIQDTNVLWSYHTNLVRKAIEYSAGIIDYFFRGALEVSLDTVPGDHHRLHIVNRSGQTLKGGNFILFVEDAYTSVRTLHPMTVTWDNTLSTLADGVGIDATFDSPRNKFVLVYKGTIGWNGSPTTGSVDDSIDENVGVASVVFIYDPPV